MLAMAAVLPGCMADTDAPDVDIPGAETLGKDKVKDVVINVLLTAAPDDAMLGALGGFSKKVKAIEGLDAVSMVASPADLDAIRALPFVEAANPDAERKGSPIDTVPAGDFVDGLSTWNLDAINVTDGPFFGTRAVAETGEGVYVAVLDTGLLDTWRQYFPEERIAEEYAKAFGGGGGEVGFVHDVPNKWEHDVNSHGTHVTSTILGFNFYGTPINGVAPGATVIPVKVLGQAGFGWSSVVAMGIKYIGDLKAGPLHDSPVVINMSLGGPSLDAIEQAAMDYAIAQGVIIVAAAGNEGDLGMGYPGGYEPVISVAASGWAGEWMNDCWWYCVDDPDPANTGYYYITDFSSWAYPGQDLDVTAPGSWIVGPYQLQRGKSSYYFLGGTSMASPHVAGLAALMAQKSPTLNAAQAENILETTALDITGWSAMLQGHGLVQADAALDAL